MKNMDMYVEVGLGGELGLEEDEIGVSVTYNSIVYEHAWKICESSFSEKEPRFCPVCNRELVEHRDMPEKKARILDALKNGDMSQSEIEKYEDGKGITGTIGKSYPTREAIHELEIEGDIKLRVNGKYSLT